MKYLQRFPFLFLSSYSSKEYCRFLTASSVELPFDNYGTTSDALIGTSSNCFTFSELLSNESWLTLSSYHNNEIKVNPADSSGLTGGFKPISKSRYNYKNQ